jgi:ATP:ADP antiporter, AAA family
MIISFLQTIFRPIFGSFEKEELKKYLRMGATFTFIIGSYWTMRALKNALFCTLAGASLIPYAKTVSLILLVPLVVFYTKLIDRFSHKKTFYYLSTVYAFMTIIFALLLMSPIGQASTEVICSRTGLYYYATTILGFAWYVFVESYGSLVIALFWAIASSTTMPESAKKGFSLVVAVGQIGGIVGPYFIGGLPHYLNLQTNALSILLCGVVIFLSILSLNSFLTKTPKELLASFTGSNEKEEEKKQDPGFFEGLKLLVSKKYLLGIFGVISFFEIIITVFDMHFQTLAASQMFGTQLSQYMGAYASWVNIIAFLCLIAGIGNITRILGVSVALLLMPIIYAGAITGFITFDSLNFLFALMVGSKAINYALNGPAIKQLYIPTTPDVRFKSQAWIETFGSRGAKEAGSIFNMFLNPLQTKFGVAMGRAMHVMYSAYLGYSIVVCWFIVAFFLGRTYKKAVKEKKVIC